MEPALQALLEQHAPHFVATGEGKVMCELNGHCMPPRADVVAAFIAGGKYAKLLQRWKDEQHIKKLEPFLVPSTNDPSRLFCALTGQLVNRTAAAAKLHMQGKRFKKAKDRFMADEQDLLEERRTGEQGGESGSGGGADEGASGSDAEGGGGGALADGASPASDGSADDTSDMGSSGSEGDGEEGPGFWVPEGEVDAEMEAADDEPPQRRRAGKRGGGGAAAKEAAAKLADIVMGEGEGGGGGAQLTAVVRSKKKVVQPKAKRTKVGA